MRKILNYLDHPITSNGHYGSDSDIGRAGPLVFAARRDQATFNLVALLDPSIHRWNIPFKDLPSVAHANRPYYDNVFVRPYQAMGFALDDRITLADLCLHFYPAEVLKVLREHTALREHEFLKHAVMRAFLDGQNLDEAAEMASSKLNVHSARD